MGFRTYFENMYWLEEGEESRKALIQSPHAWCIHCISVQSVCQSIHTFPHVTLQLLPSRGGVYLPTLGFWAWPCDLSCPVDQMKCLALVIGLIVLAPLQLSWEHDGTSLLETQRHMDQSRVVPAGPAVAIPGQPEASQALECEGTTQIHGMAQAQELN